MYRPPAFRADDAEALRLIDEHPLAQLVVVADGVPIATPVPLIRRGDSLVGHLARPNPVLRHPGNALALFTGADAYISPRWYANKPVDGKVVPTWNYVTVQAHGPVEFFDDPERLLAAVTRLTMLHEGPRARPWDVSDAPPDYIAAQLRGIVGLRIPITRIEGKRKMSQNRSEADRRGVAQGLAESARPEERLAASLIPT